MSGRSIRLIDKDELLRTLEQDINVSVTGAENMEAVRRCLQEVLDDVRNSPEVDLVRHGKWRLEWETEDTRMLRCSECRMVFNVGKGRDGNYCPNCGARMDEDEAD